MSFLGRIVKGAASMLGTRGSSSASESDEVNSVERQTEIVKPREISPSYLERIDGRPDVPVGLVRLGVVSDGDNGVRPRGEGTSAGLAFDNGVFGSVQLHTRTRVTAAAPEATPLAAPRKAERAHDGARIPVAVQEARLSVDSSDDEEAGPALSTFAPRTTSTGLDRAASYNSRSAVRQQRARDLAAASAAVSRDRDEMIATAVQLLLSGTMSPAVHTAEMHDSPAAERPGIAAARTACTEPAGSSTATPRAETRRLSGGELLNELFGELSYAIQQGDSKRVSELEGVIHTVAEASPASKESTPKAMIEPERSSLNENTDIKTIEPKNKSVTHADDACDARQSGGAKSEVKLEKYDARTESVELFLQRFEDHSKFYNWNKATRAFRLRTALKGDAAQILLDLSGIPSDEELINALRLRYGTDQEKLRFRRELMSFRRSSNQSAGEVYTEVQRLLRLGYPGITGETVDSIGMEAFINAFAKPRFRERLRDKDPSSLKDAFVKASIMLSNPDCDADDVTELEQCKPVASVTRAVEHADDSKSIKFDELKELMKEQNKNISSMKDDFQRDMDRLRTEVKSVKETSKSSTGGAANSGSSSYSKTGEGQDRNRKDKSCYHCKEPGHFKRDCPKLKDMEGGQGQVLGLGEMGGWSGLGASAGAPSSSAKSGVSVSDSCLSRVANSASGVISDITYVKILVKRKKLWALCDTGASCCMTPSKYIAPKDIRPCAVDIYTASGHKVVLLGVTTIHFKIGGVPLVAEFLVSDEISEMILSFKLLCLHNVVWDTGKGTLTLKGRTIKLSGKPARPSVRRVYAREKVVIPPNATALVPVRMPFRTLSGIDQSWLIETKKLRDSDVLTANSLLPNSDQCAAISVLNLSDRKYTVRGNTFLGEAHAGEVLCKFDEEITSNSGEPSNPCTPPCDIVDASNVPCKNVERCGENVFEICGGVDDLCTTSDEILPDTPLNAALIAHFESNSADIFSGGRLNPYYPPYCGDRTLSVDAIGVHAADAGRPLPQLRTLQELHISKCTRTPAVADVIDPNGISQCREHSRCNLDTCPCRGDCLYFDRYMEKCVECGCDMNYNNDSTSNSVRRVDCRTSNSVDRCTLSRDPASSEKLLTHASALQLSSAPPSSNWTPILPICRIDVNVDGISRCCEHEGCDPCLCKCRGNCIYFNLHDARCEYCGCDMRLVPNCVLKHVLETADAEAARVEFRSTSKSSDRCTLATTGEELVVAPPIAAARFPPFVCPATEFRLSTLQCQENFFRVSTLILKSVSDSFKPISDITISRSADRGSGAPRGGARMGGGPRFFATLPVTTATAERSFSTLRRLKTYLRTTMTGERLNGLALMTIHRDISTKIDPQDVISRLAKKSRRLDFVI